MQNHHLELKFIIVGDQAVGKSCFVQQFLNQNIRETYEVTIGVEFGIKKINVGDEVIKIQIWDTAGQENFKSITRSYFRGAIGAFIMYDITRRQTYEHVKTWLDEIRESGNKYVCFYLIGNKNDLEESRAVSKEQGSELAKKFGMMFTETSFRDQNQANSSFAQLAGCVLEKIQNNQIPLNLENIGIKAGNRASSQHLSQFIDKPPRRSCC